MNSSDEVCHLIFALESFALKIRLKLLDYEKQKVEKNIEDNHKKIQKLQQELDEMLKGGKNDYS